MVASPLQYSHASSVQNTLPEAAPGSASRICVAARGARELVRGAARRCEHSAQRCGRAHARTL
eukprot:scaffold28_cov515-Prasinococcus_capsulatus_cf.AAC.21